MEHAMYFRKGGRSKRQCSLGGGLLACSELSCRTHVGVLLEKLISEFYSMGVLYAKNRASRLVPLTATPEKPGNTNL